MIEFGLSRQLTKLQTVTDCSNELIFAPRRMSLRRIGKPHALASTLLLSRDVFEVSVESLARTRAAGGLQGPVLW